MNKRAAAQSETRERIVQATLELHDEQGVATTTFADVAARAGVGAATVLRHFPTIGQLVDACGQHVAADMQPPSPADAQSIFEGIETTHGRLERLADELDAFYARGAARLIGARNDRDRVPELDRFLTHVDAGIEAQVREALALESPADPIIGVAMALCDIAVWQRLRQAIPAEDDRRAILVELLQATLAVMQKKTA